MEINIASAFLEKKSIRLFFDTFLKCSKISGKKIKTVPGISIKINAAMLTTARIRLVLLVDVSMKIGIIIQIAVIAESILKIKPSIV